MKKIIKNNIKVFVSIIISAVIFTSIGVYAAGYLAKDISYNKNGQATVADALDDLYSKEIHSYKEVTILDGNKNYNCNSTVYSLEDNKFDMNKDGKYFVFQEDNCAYKVYANSTGYYTYIDNNNNYVYQKYNKGDMIADLANIRSSNQRYFFAY